MDLDGDGKKDMISGSWPGELYVFPGKGDGSFAGKKVIQNLNNGDIRLGSASAVFAADWDRDGDLDLLVGNIEGEVYFVPNESGDKELVLGDAKKVNANGKAIRTPGGDSGPCVADWDSDGNHDLLVGAGNGSVLFYRNTASKGLPELAKPVKLVHAGSSDGKRGGCGTRSKICVADWNGDGRLDLLMGDFSLTREKPPKLTKEQRAELSKAQKASQKASRKWSQLRQEANVKVREELRLGVGRNMTTKQRRELARKTTEEMKQHPDYDSLLKKLQEYGRITQKYTSPVNFHGWVWVFLRKSGSKVASGR